MKFSVRILLACSLLVALVAAGCGDDNNFQKTEVPQLTLDAPSGGSVVLRPPQPSDRIQSQTPVSFRNSGEVDMEVTSIKWASHPPRLVGAGDYTGTQCQYDASATNYDASGNCADGTMCWPITGECRVQGLPDTPFTVPSNQLKEISTVLLPGSGDIQCPEAPSGRDNVPSDYCGELVIKTDANNDGPSVKGGTLRVYFTYAAGSGTIDVSPRNLSFAGVEAGGSDSQDVTVTNTASEGDLTISEISVREHSDMFTVTGAESAPTTIAPGSQKSWSVEFHPSADWDGQTIGTNLEILSSGTNERTTLVHINAVSQQDLPAIKLDPQVLRFDADTTQTLTVSNEGAANLVMQSLTVRPANAAGLYSFSINGQSADQQVPSNEAVVKPGESADIEVQFSPPTGDQNTIGTVELSYNYYVGAETRTDTASATLLGDAGDAAVAMLAPDVFTFQAASGNTAERSFAVRNVGNQPLNITSADLTASLGSESTFSVDGSSWTVPAGGLQEITVTYTADDNEMDNVTLSLPSNTAGDPLSVLLVAQPGQGGSAEAKITPSFGDDTTVVGEEARFSAQQSTGFDQSALDTATWVLLERPAGSSAFVQKIGAQAGFFPDVAGSYKISVVVDNGSVGSQATYTFTAE